jgi:carboxylate-amine ligase
MLAWFVDDVVDELGSRREVEYAFQIMRDGTSADRQLATYERTGGDLKAVVDQLIAETAEGTTGHPIEMKHVDASQSQHADAPPGVTPSSYTRQPVSSALEAR